MSDVKVEGLKVLLKAVNPSALDFLVLTSSMATVTGSPGTCVLDITDARA